MAFQSCVFDEDFSEARQDYPYDLSGPKVTYYTSIRLEMPVGMPTRAEEDLWEDSYDSQDFVEGNPEEESKINNLLLILYDKDGNYISHIETDNLKPFSTNEPDSEDSENEEDEEKDDSESDVDNSDSDSDKNTDDSDSDERYTPSEDLENMKWSTVYTLPVEIPAELTNENIASYYAIVNYDNSILNQLKETTAPDQPVRLKKLNDLVSVKVGSSAYSSSSFLMTTAVHYNSKGELCWYDKKPEDKDIIYPYVKEATKNPVVINVERVASRIDVKMPTNIDKIKVVYGTDIYELAFKPVNWAMEALEPTSYLVKRHKDKEDYEGDPTWYSDFSRWIDYNMLRTFWAESPNYDNVYASYLYPATGAEKTALALDYNIFSQIDREFNRTMSKTKEKWGRAYLLEHTFLYNGFRNTQNPYSVPTSLVILGQYSAKNTGNDLYIPNPEYTHPTEDEEEGEEEALGAAIAETQKVMPDFTADGCGFYLRDINPQRENVADNNKTEYDDLHYRLYCKTKTNDQLKDSLLREQYVFFYKKASDTKYTVLKKIPNPKNNAKDPSAILNVSNTYVRLNAGGTSWDVSPNAYTLQLVRDWKAIWDRDYKSDYGDLYYAIYNADDPDGDFFELVYDDNRENKDHSLIANRHLQKLLGYAVFYNRGQGFFYAPVPHYSGSYDPYKENGYKGLLLKNDSGEVINYTGDFGIVRNHIYSFEISGISSLAYGRTEEDNIPLPDPKTDGKIYKFDIKLEVLPWHIIDYPYINIGGSNNKE